MALGNAVLAADVDSPTVPWRSTAALAALRLGEEGTARSLANEHLHLARLWGTSTDVGAALRVAARV